MVYKYCGVPVHHKLLSCVYRNILTRAREIVGFAGSGPIFETEDRFISRQEAKKIGP